ncbi:hypothetical protein GGI35DRAFT_258954 [Trichoderma velutinum]
MAESSQGLFLFVMVSAAEFWGRGVRGGLQCCRNFLELLSALEASVPCHDLGGRRRTRLPGLCPSIALRFWGELGIEGEKGCVAWRSELAVKELRQDGSLDWITGDGADVPREMLGSSISRKTSFHSCYSSGN